MTGSDPKAHLHRYLQAARDVLLWKLDGLSEYDVRRPLTPTGTNLLGLVKHVASVEAGYLGDTFGRPFGEPLPWYADGAESNADMWATAAESRAQIVAFYRRVWTNSDATIAALPLDAPGRVRHWPPERAAVTLHQILLHVIAETHRHAGHADIVRELIDGAAGYRADVDNLPDERAAWWTAYRDRLEAVARAAGDGPATGTSAVLDERFPGPDLDPQVWTTSYLPAWSSRAAAAAHYRVAADGLHLSVPPEHPLWCPEEHETPLRVSAVQSGNWSGPVGSTRGQQPFRPGLLVREAQPTVLGFGPRFGRIEVECRADIGPRSMFSAWLVGIEDEPARCGEICLVEVFGDTVADGTAAVGSGIHPFRDPALTEEFGTERMAIDVAAPHRYAVDWRPGRVEFFLDDRRTRVCAQAPDYPMQLMLGVFDFPAHPSARPGPPPTPELVVHRVVGSR